MPARNIPPSKRMRLGTRSCAECRRRKVRCIFPPQSTICKECLAHDTPCRSQQPRSLSSSDNADSIPESMEEVQGRLQSLESMVRQLLNQKTDQDRSTTVDPDRAVEILSHGQAVTPAATMKSFTSTIHDTPSHGENFDQAPLVNLFKRTLNVRSHNITKVDHISRTHPIDEYIEALKALVPQIDDLLLILESTVKYWFIWPAQPPGSAEKPAGYAYGKAAMVKGFILESFDSRQPLQIAKGILWLALCIQQLPENSIQQRKMSLPAPQTLFDAYLSGAHAILTALEESPPSLSGLECLLLLAKICINMGRPQRAWLTVRKAVSYALLLGLHRSNKSSDSVEQSLWSQVWQMDRHLSSILGVPYSVAHPQSSTLSDQPIAVKLMYRINNVVGRISDLNQGLLPSSIQEIETEIQECASLFPEDWWHLTLTEDLPFESVYARQVCKMYFLQLKITLYLPDMLRALKDPDASQVNRENAVEACRGMVCAYEVLRNSSKSALVICDLMDFIVFSAALILVIHLLAPAPPGPRKTHSDDAEEDWGIITHLIQTFRQLSRAIECSVANQAATLLEYLYTAHHDAYVGPEEYVAVIPWFGKVKIIRSAVLQRQEIIIPSSLQTTPFLEDQSEESLLRNTIEVGINYVTPGTGSASMSDSWAVDYMDNELGIDWTSVNELDWEYDWNQMFYSAGYDKPGL